MSRFYAEIWPDAKKVVSRCGHTTIISHVRGWNYGIRVEVSKNERGNNEYKVYKTGGSNDPFISLIHNYEEL